MVSFLSLALALLALTQAVIAQKACTAPTTRREFRELSDGDKQLFMNAVKCLRNPQQAPSMIPSTGSRTLYDDLVYIHRQFAPQTHNGASFLPWHRGMLALFESWMSTKCGWNGGLPFWDWTLDSQAPQNSVLLTNRWFGSNGNPNQQNCIYNGQFVGTRTVFTNPGTSNCIHRWFNVNNRPTSGPSLYNSVAVQTLLQNSRSSYASFRNNFESQPHNLLHTSMGGDMFVVAISPNDPLFYLHHANVDRLWTLWQRNNPTLANTYNDFNRPVTINDIMQYNSLYPNTPVRSFLSTTAGDLMCYRYSNSVAPTGLLFTGTAAPADVNATSSVPGAADKTRLKPVERISETWLKHMNYTKPEIAAIREQEALVNNVVKFANKAGFVSHDAPVYTGTQEWRPVTDKEVAVRTRMLSMLADTAKEAVAQASAPMFGSDSNAISGKVEAVLALSKLWTLA
ncbi:uncharacterized protein EV422DRAFT_518599 [Fimicolochytrium jonesii]|uniref:uncharacterized protein n=1 Tax=Fimicolochytrium jonesii TaxID=1396493 RepID=UPI0022FE75A2|nr:uncharacterized protein EV422DRAFT_518599 [Fimicolochytrium jonesii]KAI8824011.1 hypothetical protein EV422DRAFT_518599 [Fimicolochytrium jonesii]